MNSSIVHPQPLVVHTSSCNCPYKFKCKGSTYVSANEVNTTQGAVGAAAAATTDIAASTAEGKAPMQKVATLEAEAAA